MVDLTAYKVGYCQMKRSETIGTADKTGITLNINMGECGMGGGSGGPGGGAGGAPNVIFSGPPDGMQNFPTTEKLRVGFNQPLDSTTVNDGSADAVTDNVYLMNNITGAVVTGTVTYCANSSSPGCSSLFSMDTNTILFTPNANLATSTGYALIVTEKVKSQGGESVMGNRPGGGHRVSFTTVGGMFDMGAIGGSYGTTGQFMPPFVRSVNPAPGMGVAGNTKITVEFNQAMQSSTITTSNIKLRNKTAGSYVTLSSVTLDSTESRFVKLTPQSSLTSGSEYEVEVYGAVASAQGITMRGPADAAQKAFSSFFMVSSASDNTAPTLYPSLANGATAVPVNQVFEFGANEQLDFNTVNTTNITMYRGATAATVGVSYDPGKNSVFVAPISALAPNTAYTITFSPSVTDLAGNGVATTTYSYTTGSGDSVKPTLREARCDDYKCRMVFTEPMNRDTQADTNWANSAVNPANWTITKVSGSVDIPVTGKPMNYNSVDYSVTVEGIAGLASGDQYRVTASSSIKDLSENAVETTSSANIFIGTAESSAQTFGQFGDMGMFSPPTSGMTGGGAVGGGTFTPQGFGNFTAEQFAFGNADQAFPFNSMAGKDVNVFQVRFKPGVALANGDKIAITFPSGTNITNAVLDTQSPFLKDASEGANTIASSTALVINTTERTITITYAITGTATTSDSYVIDLTKIINPSIPKGPSTGGYTVTLQSLNGTTVTASKTSMPYFIDAGGSNTITVSVQAGASPVSGADGTIYLHGGGPSGPMEKVLTMTDGLISAVNGTLTTSVAYTSLRDGCYFVGTEPMVTLGGADYFGQMSPEPICVNGGQSSSKTITFTAAGGGASVPVTVKLVKTGGFGGKDIDIFAGGPGKYVVKTLTNVTTPDAGGYTLNLPANGHWNIGVGPAMSKGSSSGIPQSLGVMTPPPTDVVVSGLGGTPAVSTGMFTPPGVSFNDTTDTLTITFANADKVISGTVKDGSGNALPNMEVFINRQGFGAPLFTQTDAAGAFSLSVADNGTYEIGVSKQGMPPVVKMIDVRGSGTNYVDGKLIDGGNPFVIVMKKASYTISGKVLDADSNSIGGAPLFATNATGNTVFGQSGSDGSYTLFVDNGSWTINVQMPPEKNDACGTFSKTVVVSGASQSSQNITPTTGTCVTLSGTVTAGSALANVPLFIEEWNAGTNAPVANGFKRPASTASNGTYSVKVLTNKTYRIGIWHPDYGEISTTQAVVASNVTKDITLTADTVTFNFTGGSATMNAMIELKDAANKNKVIRKQVNGLASSVVMNIESGSTYGYFVDVFGFGKYSGSVVSTGGADTVTIDLSGTEFVTISGVVKDADGNALSGAAINLFSTSTNMVVNDLTDANGAYEIKVKAGSYQMAPSLSGYMAPAPTSVTFSTTTTNYDFAPSQDQTPLTVSSYAISGTIYNSSAAAMSEGFVWATNASGTVVSSPTNADGTYSLPVNAGVWTVKAVGPLHAETTLGSTVTVTTGNQTGKNITLTADATRIPKSATGVLSASTGGSLNDEGTSGMKLTVGSGVLETGSGNVTVNMEKGFNAPDSASYQALDNTTFSFEASGDSSIKTLNGNAEIQLNYTDLVSKLPAGISEANLQLMYYSPERGDYVPVEGGFTVDTTNNTVTGLVNHFTDFVLAYVPTAEGVPAAPTGLTATAASSNQINLSWTAVSGATSYNVHRSATSGGTYADVASTSGTTYSNTGLSASTLYYYKITASNTSGEGASSDAASATTNAIVGGGGGGYYVLPVIATTTIAVATTTVATTTIPAVTSTTPVVVTPTTQNISVSKIEATFTKILKKGMKDGEVTRLQTLFAKDKSIYPEGDVTGYFGPATERAVQRFQTKYGLVTSGTPATTGYGALGPKTRAKILEVFSGKVVEKVVPATQNAQPSERAKTVSPVFNIALQKGMKNAQVKQLQVILNSNPATRVAETGDGSLGHETEYFGAATMKAVQKFQELYGLAKQGDTAFGFVGPKTRAKLSEISNGQ
jgi:peptidoglycan hydrolase-like protein with peptidoglycan-binding domain